MLLVLLIQTGAAYARMARSFAVETSVREQRLHEVQAELIHVSRLTELGQMVSALAHEVNQPLSAVGSYVSAARRLLAAPDTGRAHEALQNATDQVIRASQVIQQLREFVRKADGVIGRPKMCARRSRKRRRWRCSGRRVLRVRLAMDFGADLPPVLIDKVQIQQVLLHLIRNAIEAMHDSSRRELTIGAMRVRQ